MYFNRNVIKIISIFHGISFLQSQAYEDYKSEMNYIVQDSSYQCPIIHLVGKVYQSLRSK